MIEPSFLEELETFNLALKKHSVENTQGEQASEAVGEGLVFEDHKKYVPGDDIRKIDWKVYARTESYFVKRFEEEKAITIHILVDRSSSMDYGEPSKFEVAAKLGLGIAYMSASTSNRFRLSVFSETVTEVSSARRDPHLGGIIDILNDLPFTPESLLERCMLDYHDRIRNKSIVVIISDFLMDNDEIRDTVDRMDSTDLVLVNVLDDSELSPDFMGDFILEAAESDARIRTYISELTQDAYTTQLQDHVSSIQEACTAHGAEFVQVSTGTPFFDSFLDVWNAINS